MTDENSEMVKVRFGDQETGWAEPLPDGTFRIDNIPLEEWLNIDDVVTCIRESDGWFRVAEVIESAYPHKTAFRYDTVEQYQAVRKQCQAAGARIEGMFGPQQGKPGLALVAHGDEFDPIAAARDAGVEDPEIPTN